MGLVIEAKVVFNLLLQLSSLNVVNDSQQIIDLLKRLVISYIFYENEEMIVAVNAIYAIA